MLMLGCLAAALGQTPADQTKQRDALTKAMRITMPAEPINAMEQFIKDFPSSTYLSTVYNSLFRDYAATAKDDRVLTCAEELIQSDAESYRARIQYFLHGASLPQALGHANECELLIPK